MGVKGCWGTWLGWVVGQDNLGQRLMEDSGTERVSLNCITWWGDLRKDMIKGLGKEMVGLAQGYKGGVHGGEHLRV